MTGFDRRRFLKLFAASTGCFVLGALPVPFVSRLTGAMAAPGSFHFPQGLASGDPQPDAVMLWTRVQSRTGSPDLPIAVTVQISQDEEFSTLVLERELRAEKSADHTLRVLVSRLKPDTRYFYRFIAGADQPAFIGRTRTAPPATSLRPARFAVLGGANSGEYTASAFRQLIDDDQTSKPGNRIDFVLHLGDPLPSTGESDINQTLADYRTLYKSRLRDPGLQAARASFPFIHIRNDQTVAHHVWPLQTPSDTHASPTQAENHAANRAWHEFTPAILPDALSTPTFHRTISWGRFLDLVVTDLHTAEPTAIMGASQKAWFKSAMKSSRASWRIWANSAPALAMRLDFSNLSAAGLKTAHVGAAGWQDRPGELQELLSFLHTENITNVISCTGASHAHVAGRVPVDPDAAELAFAAIEFATAGLGFETMFSAAQHATRGNALLRRMVEIEQENGAPLENLNTTLVDGLRAGLLTNYTNSTAIGAMFRNERANPGLAYVDSNARGYSIATVTADDFTIEMVNIGDGKSAARRTRFQTRSWADTGQPILSEPEFEGAAPFPYPVHSA